MKPQQNSMLCFLLFSIRRLSGNCDEKGLAIPLTMAQIEAANELHQGLPQWKSTDDALHALHNRFPEFEIKATLLR